ncbi:hypothetical protein [Paraburkholderia megapolitana]|uniref:hypothetical protein n=1 Tax=Paraburkholderia megapolitana TaxID=420953 RepID=UPI0038BE1AFF
MPKVDKPMPEISAFVERLREAFGRGEIDALVRRGRAGEPVFFAREGGMEFGTPLPAGSPWDSSGVIDRQYCRGCAGECIGSGEPCTGRRPGTTRER